MLRTATAGAVGAAAASLVSRPGTSLHAANEVAADPRILGPFLILSTPFTASGEVDYDSLAREACYLDWCGCPGMIWPQSGDSIDLLTNEEKLKGMEVLAETSRKLKTTALCLGVQGKDTDEMLMFARHVEKLNPPAMISRPLDSGKTEDDLRQYWSALAAVAKRPVFIQTTGGVTYKGPIPSVKLLVELAEKFPRFGYVKEEAGDVFGRMRQEIAAKPPIRRVFSARGGYHWLKELQMGSEGLITERNIYADVLTHIWRLHQSGSDPAAMKDAFGKFLQMLKLNKSLPGSDLRGIQLYLLKKRGVFQTMVSRHYGPNKSIPESPIYSDLKLSPEDIVKIERGYETLTPYRKPGEPSFAAAAR
ncbi:dihydrodipicolinate synthase family protein [Planctomycetales bacterium ZRK34]|nr:dihydrodipicolinate synthase family protein [Planctomycetales bacterium ZRK34]